MQPQNTRPLGGCLLVTSCLFNILLLIGLGIAVVMLALAGMNRIPSWQLDERFHSGNGTAKNKIAIVNIEGILLEGFISYAEKQIDQAAKDEEVKAIVLRISSPGGSVTASDHLYRLINKLQRGDPDKNTPAKPVVVSMGAIAASGGYYLAAPGQTLLAEPSTITGSIGVYVALPNIKKLADDHGVKIEVIKRGEVKYSGSPFQDLKPHEREMWQEGVDNAFNQFKKVIEDGRPQLKGKLEDNVIDQQRTVADDKGEKQQIRYVRKRADGGTFTAEQALKFGLIDRIGYLDDAVKAASELADLGSNYKAITYEKPHSLIDLLLGTEIKSSSKFDPDLANLSEVMTPRMWYLAPGHEIKGALTAARKP